MSAATNDDETVWIVHSFVDERRDADPALLELLSDDERARHARLHFARDRAAFSLAHALVRKLLSELLGGPPRAHRMEPGPHGKPALWPAVRGLDFNLSHTHGLVACAFSWGAPVGVDVEHTARTADQAQVGRRVFSPTERAALAALPPDAQADRFFEYWTLKEAYMKARGLGFALPPASFELLRDGAGEVALRHLDSDEPLSGWSLFETRVGPEHRLACAAGARPRRFRVEPRQL